MQSCKCMEEKINTSISYWFGPTMTYVPLPRNIYSTLYIQLWKKSTRYITIAYSTMYSALKAQLYFFLSQLLADEMLACWGERDFRTWFLPTFGFTFPFFCPASLSGIKRTTKVLIFSPSSLENLEKWEQWF